MYRFDDIGSTFLSLPPNLQTTENACFAYAFDRQIKILHRLAKKLTVWSDLDNADPKYYDYMAISIRAPYYKSEYSEKQKLGLIKSALESRIYAGTARAIEGLLQRSILYAKFVPWYEYGGKPYHFKIETSDDPGEESRTLFANMLQRVKAARSIIDGVEIDHAPVRNPVYIGIGISHHRIVHVQNKEKLEYRVCGTLYAGCATVIRKQIVISQSVVDDHTAIRNITYTGVGIGHYRIVHVQNKEELGYRVCGTLYAGCATVIRKQIVISQSVVDDHTAIRNNTITGCVTIVKKQVMIKGDKE